MSLGMKKVNFICPVPQEQRPINEYKKVKDSVSFFWSTEDFRSYCQNIFKVTFISLFLNFFLVLASTNEGFNLYGAFLYSLIFTSLILIFICLRTYLGWKYIYDRLVQATVAYEESGWYDGQVWVKTPEILMQDKLAGTYKVLPLLNRLKNTVLIFLVISALSFFLLK